MNIVYLITGLGLGGAERQLVSLVESMINRAHHVTVVSLLEGGHFKDDIEALGVDVIGLGMERAKFNLQGFIRLVRIIASSRPAILHAHMFHANMLARICKLFLPRMKVICTIHNTFEKGALSDLAYRFTNFLADHTTQVSAYGLAQYQLRGVLPRTKSSFIPNGLDTAVFSKPLSSRQELTDSRRPTFHWLAVGRLEPQKDYDNLLHAFYNIIISQQVQSTLTIAGEGPLRLHLEARVRELGIETHVQFVGAQKDILDWYHRVDALVVSSAWEGLPMVVLEAAACERPIVATAVGGIPEIIQDGVTGILVEAKNSTALTSAMLRMMQLPSDVRSKMGQILRARVVQQFGRDAVVRRWEQLYFVLAANEWQRD